MTQPNATQVVRDAIDLFGRSAEGGTPTEAITHAIVVGPSTTAMVDAARAQLPALREVWVVEPDDDASVIQTHLRLVTWLLERDAPIAATPWFVDPAVGEAHAVARTVEDLLWSGSAAFFAELDASHPGFWTAAPLLRAWSDRLSAQSLVLPALRCDLALHRAAADPALARRIGIAWGRLGAPARALAWLRRSDLPPAALQAIAADLAAADAELRGEAAAMLAENLAHLRREWPAVAAVLERTTPSRADVVWTEDVPWRLCTSDGGARVERDALPRLVDERDGVLVEAVAPEHPRHLARALLEHATLDKRHTCVGSLLDYAAFVNVIANPLVSSVPGWRQSVYAIEADPGALRRLLEAVDLRELTSRRRLQALEVGPAAEATLAVRFRAAPRRPLPRIRVACSAALADELESVDADRLAVGRAALAQIAARDDLGVPTRTLAKLRAGRPLRIWAWTSIHTAVLQHVAAGLAAGMRALGHEVELVVEGGAHEQVEPAQVAASLAAADPDLAFLVDHLRPEFGALLPRTLPFAAWILDELPPLSDPRVIGKLDRFDLSFAWSRSLAGTYRERGYPHCAPLLFAVDAATYDVPATGPAEDVVAYATHLSFPREPAFAPGLYRDLEARMMAMPEVPSGMDPLEPLLAASVQALGIVVPPGQAGTLAYDCLIIARHVDRVRIADSLLAAGIPVALFGNGWSEIPRFAPHAKGIVAPGAALRDLYQRHKVVLHINKRCNLHLRVLEASAAGGFVLARSEGAWDLGPLGVNDHLEVDRELCVFTDEADLVAKVKRAFADEPWRQGFVQAARARVLRDHTYVERARTMLAEVERHLGTVLGGEIAGAA